MRMAHPAWLGALALSGLLIAPPAHAQAGQPSSGDQLELTRANIQTRRQEIVQQLMELTPAESGRESRPIYREFRNEIAETGRPESRVAGPVRHSGRHHVRRTVEEAAQ